MRRREFLQNSLRGAGAVVAASLPVPLLAAASATVPGLSLARLEGEGAQRRWQDLHTCAAACGGQARVRIDIDALAFPDAFASVAVEAMFVTDVGLTPFRIAAFDRGAVSPVSKPFGFEAARDGLAGLRVERRLDGDVPSHGVASAGLLGGIHAQLAPGRYLLALAPDAQSVRLADVGVTDVAGDAVTLRDGSVPRFGYVVFSVRAVT